MLSLRWAWAVCVCLAALATQRAASISPIQPMIQTSNGSILIVLPAAANASVAYMDEQGNVQAPVMLATKNDISTLQSTIQSMQLTISSLQSQLTGEVSRASTSESSISTSVQTLFSSMATATVAGEVARAQAVESSLGTSVSSAIASATALMNQEKSRAQGTETSLAVAANALQTAESSLSLSIEASFTTSIASETSRASNTEASLASATSRAVAVENSLGSALAAEVVRATNTDASLSVAGLQGLQATQASLASSVGAEASRAVGVEASLSLSILGQTSRAMSTEASLSSQISNAFGSSSLSSVLAAQVSMANAEASMANADALVANAEVSLSGALQSEVSRAMAAEASLSHVSPLGFYWLTTQGSLGSFNYGVTVNQAIAATDVLGSTINFVLVAGSVPPGVTFSSSGWLRGTIALDVTTTYSFSVNATSTAFNTTLSRSFSMSTFNRLLTVNGITYYNTPGVPQTVNLTTNQVFSVLVYNSHHLVVTCVGAAGSTLYSSGAETFGYGGSVTGTYQSILPGLYYVVAGQQPSAGAGGFPGGGTGLYTGSGGGGFSAFWTGTSSPTNTAQASSMYLVGGAGAGHSNDYTSGASNNPSSSSTQPGYPRGGDGGYPSGSIGNANSQNMVVPTGGTQTAGGSPGLNNAGSAQGATAGSQFQGGNSGDCGGTGSGGAGGGGWFGGGGGNAHCGQGGGAGGGGSSYYNPLYISNFSYVNAMNTASGYVTLTMGVTIGSVAGPTWQNPASGFLGSYNYSQAIYVALYAADRDGYPVTFSLSSGSLPTGVTLSTVGSNGLLTGNILTDATTTYTITLRATSNGISTLRTFNFTTYKRLLTVDSTTYYHTPGVLQTITLSSAGTVYPITVYNSHHIQVTCVGAAGSTKYTSGTETFGYGGSVTGTLASIQPSSPPNMFYFVVPGVQPTAAAGGYPGGGVGNENGAGGGGFSGFWMGALGDPLNVTQRATYYLIGGAGGAHSSDYTAGSSSNPSSSATEPGYPRAGDGGYPTGSVGNANSVGMVIPTGGSQTAGGSAGLDTAGAPQGTTAGSAYYGGGSGVCGTGSGAGGAGGGGWYGGGGGNAHCGQGGGAGGGGSSYYNVNLITNFSYVNAFNTGNGYIQLVLGLTLGSASSAPIWQTPAGSLGQFNYGSSPVISLVAYDSLSNPMSYVIVGGTLPPGLNLVTSGSQAIISGSPNADRTLVYNFSVTATGINNLTATRNFSITIFKRLLTVNSITYYQIGSAQSVTLTGTGTPYPITVYNAFSLTVTCVGAAGSTYYTSGSSTFGYGGSVTGTYANIPNTTNYYVIVGAQPSGQTGGYPGGGLGYATGAGGGGFSGFWMGATNDPLATTSSSYLLIGGAGAGHSSDYTAGSSNNPASTATEPGYLRAGDGGYPTGSIGNGNSVGMVVPTGGTQTAGGAAGLNQAGSAQGATAGSQYFGGQSGNCGGTGAGGAGGGGWFGGGGGNAHCGQGGGAGGGGSSYYNNAYITAFSYGNAVNTGNGYVILSF